MKDATAEVVEALNDRFDGVAGPTLKEVTCALNALDTVVEEHDPEGAHRAVDRLWHLDLFDLVVRYGLPTVQEAIAEEERAAYRYECCGRPAGCCICP